MAETAAPLQLMVRDLSGKTLISRSYEGQDRYIQLDLNDLVEGVYWLSLRLEHQLITKKIVLSR